MNTIAGSPLPYTRYWTCTPSAATTMRGVPSMGSPSSAAAGGAAGAGGGASCLSQAARKSAPSASARIRSCMRNTLGERRGVVTDRERRSQPGALDAQEIDEAGEAVIRGGFDAEVRLRLA